MSSIKKVITLCADDYGMHSAINKAILDLAQKGRLTAISCMTNMPEWKESHQLVHLSNVSLGLHLNLDYSSLGNIIIKSYCHQLDKNAIKQAFIQQLHSFQDKIGRQPDFIDGHQHIQQLPQIRDLLVDFYLQHFPQKQVIVRNTVNHLGSFKSRVLNKLGGYTWKKLLVDHGIPTNHNFSGIYAFKQTDYATIFTQFIEKITQPTLLMCHPGQMTTEHDAFRQREYDFFAGEQFNDIVNHYKVVLKPISQVI